jgi:hypothetical protein
MTGIDKLIWVAYFELEYPLSPMDVSI